MGSLKEYYLSSSEERHERLAEALRISWQELDELDYDIDVNVSKDGLIYCYIIKISEENNPEVIKKIEGIESDLTVRVEPWVLDHDPYDEYELSAISENIEFKRNFDKEIQNIRQLLEISIEGQELKNVYYRQIFITIIGAMEVYLSDALINKVLANREYLEKFIETHPSFKKQKISLSSIFHEYKLIEDKAKSIMLDTVYHKLSNIKKMYESTFSIQFPEISIMQKFIQQRHDLVHRNGKTKQGENIVLNKNVINELIDSASSLVNDVSEKLEYGEIPF